MNRRVLLGFAAAASAASCSDPTANTVNVLNLDRPVDVAFACYGGLRLTNGAPGDPAQPVIESAMPTAACAIRSSATAENTPPGQEIFGQGTDPAKVENFAFILQSVPGTIGIARFANKPSAEFGESDVTVIDSDLLTPGKNGVAVGSLPVAIATDRIGCHFLTANAGSCDLSVVDINSILQATPAPEINRIPVVNGDGETILAKPAAMIAEPGTDDLADIGRECPAEPSGLFYVAFPSCHLVAAVDATGAIQQGIQFAADGTVTLTGPDVSCPAECGDMRDPQTDGIRPVTLDLNIDERIGTRRLAIGAEDSPTITVVDLDDTNRFTSVIEQVTLEGDIGVLDVSISPQIGMGGQLGMLNDGDSSGGEFQFVYAVATDGSVRVAEFLDEDRECETQVDPRFLFAENSVATLSCLPIGDLAYPRRALARGPGIQLTNGATAISVRIFTVATGGSGTDPRPELLVGRFAAVGTSDGRIVYVNIDDDDYADTTDSTAPLEVNVPLAVPHQLRDAVPQRSDVSTISQNGVDVPVCNTNGPDFTDPETNAGGPRLGDTPEILRDPAALDSAKQFQLPGIRQLRCIGSDTNSAGVAISELGYSAPPLDRVTAYPDWTSLPFVENWTMVWEGSLSRDGADGNDVAIDGPPVRIGKFVVDGTGMRVEDPSRPFCNAGVEQHDIVAMRGCNPNVGDADCPAGFSCYVHPDSQVSSGACLPPDEVDFLSGPCRDFLVGLRRYSVASTTSGTMKLAERAHVLTTTPPSGCTSDVHCDQLYLAQEALPSEEHPVNETAVPETRTFACEPDLSRPDPTRNRCLMTCDPAGDSSDCDAGTVCNDAGRCVEGVVPPLQCVQALQRYELRASDAYTVIGSTHGYQHSIIEDDNGACVRDPDANPLMVGRIPLTAPPCTGDSLVDLTPNPCSITVDDTRTEVRYADLTTCELADPDDELVTVPTEAIRFKNPQLTFHVVEPTYPGDQACIGDRQGTLPIAVTHPGATISVLVVDGLDIKRAGVTTTFPMRIVAGPQNSLWAVDEGDFIGNTTSTRGRVFRIEAEHLDVINTLQ
jgi:hypothetical protein